MAPKRAAKKAAPSLPPAESSDDTQSRSLSDDSEDEEAVAESPIPAASPTPAPAPARKNTPTPARKNTPAPPEKGDVSESSEDEDDEEEDEEEEGDQLARAAPKNQPPQPQEKDNSDTSGSEDDEEEEEDEEGPTRAAPPSAPKNQPPPQEKEEGSGDDDDEEEVPPSMKPSAEKEVAVKKAGAFHRIWSMDDELRILEALAAHQKQHGTFPQPEALIDVLAGKLDNPAYGSKELQSKVKSLRHRYLTLSKKGEVPSKEHDRRLLGLSKIVWDGNKTTAAASDNGHDQKGFEEMCVLYPYLAEEVKELEAAHPGMCKRVFGKMDGDKARAMDQKIKKQRVVQIKVEMSRADLFKEVTKALVNVVDG